jgi:beta-barrel assembly-enhancing protease
MTKVFGRSILNTFVSRYWLALPLVLAFSLSLFANPAIASSSARKHSKSDRDITAIGHRRITDPRFNWYSLDKEKELGAKLSANLELSTAILSDSKTATYLNRLAQTITKNSDAELPVTVRVIDSEKVYAFTLAGGYQYVTRGLLLRMDSEGTLASVLARGIAHTALRSSTHENTMASMMNIGAIPLIFQGNTTFIDPSAPGLAVPLTLLKMKRDEELKADYFGIQYLYKTGYDPECFSRFIQTVWPADSVSGSHPSVALSSFPPLSQRLTALQKETVDIFPKRAVTIPSTSAFADFQEHLRSLPAPPPVKLEPKLVRVNPQPLEQ